MTYVKKSAQILLVDDSEVGKYKRNGFKEFPVAPPASTEISPEQKALREKIKDLNLGLPEGLTDEQVKEAVEKAEQERAAANNAPPASAGSGGKNGKNSG